MKIRKFNESVDLFDMDFIHECFIDFEESNFDVDIEQTPNKLNVNVNFEFPDNMINSEGSIPDSLDKLELKAEFYENLKVSLIKVGVKYPSYKYYIASVDEFTLSVTIYSSDTYLTHEISSLM